MPNPDFTKDAQERAGHIKGVFLDDLSKTKDDIGTCVRWLGVSVAEQIRQAEQAAAAKAEKEMARVCAERIQAAREQALEEAAQVVDDFDYKADHHDTMCMSIQESAVEDFAIDVISAIRALKDQK